MDNKSLIKKLLREASENIVNEKEFSTKEREKLADKGEAMSDGSFPIDTENDLHNAIKAINRSKNPEKARRWTMKRAKEMGKSNLIPDTWNSDGTITESINITDDLIKSVLREASESHPAIELSKKISKEDKAVNTEAEKAYAKKVKEDDAHAKSETFQYSSEKQAEFKPPKRDLNDDEQKYHEEMEMSEDNLDLTYDSISDNPQFKDRQEKAVKGDSTMGNATGELPSKEKNPHNFGTEKGEGYANVDDLSKQGQKLIDAKTNRHNDTKGKTIVGPDSIVANDKTSQFKNVGSMTGKDAIIHQKTAFELSNSNKKKDTKKESVSTSNKPVIKEEAEKCMLCGKTKYVEKGLCDDCAVKMQMDREPRKNDEIKASSNNKSKEPVMVDNEHKDNNNTIPESKIKMKKLTFKKPFGGKDNAIKLVPEKHKINENKFIMTDLNETYEVRWEGDSKLGKAVILKEENKALMNEEIVAMKNLMGYKSVDTFGNLNGKERINENEVFLNMSEKFKKLLTEQEEDSDKEVI